MNMRTTVLTWGLVSGVVSIALMFATVPFIHPDRLATADILGYSSMLLAALLVFFGVRSYREHDGEGRLTFGRGVTVGVLITLVSTLCYVVAFEVMYFQIVPDFGERFVTCMVEHARAEGEAERVESMARSLKRLYDHPVTNAALSFAVTFPIGLGASLLSALILKRDARRVRL
jgi:hypothetical protein